MGLYRGLEPSSLPNMILRLPKSCRTNLISYKFDILKHVDKKVVYEKVLDKLASGGSI
jgi:hypothetical protein